MPAPVVEPSKETPGSQGTPIPSAAELQSQQTQQTNQPPNPVIEPGKNVAPAEPSKDAKIIAAQEALIREQQGRIAEMQRTYQTLDKRIAAVEAPAPTIAEQNEDFWKNPVSNIQNLVRAEMEKTVGPLNEIITRNNNRSEYDKMKDQLKVEYGDDWQHMESHVDTFVQNAAKSGNKVSAELMDVAGLTVFGALKKGKLGDFGTGAVTNAPTPTPTPVIAPVVVEPVTDSRNMTPPHLRPSAPIIPGHEKVQAMELRELTENEERLRRERGMTKEQYLNWLGVPPEQVVYSKIGKPEAAK